VSVRASILGLLVPLLAGSPIVADDTVKPPTAKTVLSTLHADHPRLILTDVGLADLKKRIEADPLLKAGREALLKEADRTARKHALKYVKRGPRLLSVSRECLRRVYVLGLAWRLTGEQRYAAAARRNLLAVCAFKDWNPSHFLDTAEMSHAVGVGYDWLFHEFAEETREVVRAGLIRNGMQPGLDFYRRPHRAARSEFNWNQVCNGGLIVGSLAIAETDPAYAKTIVPAAVRSMPLALRTYAPDGAWGEGPGYWGYATRYTVFALAALDSALGTDFGLSKMAGLSEAAWFPIYMTGPMGLYVNFADVGENSRRHNMPSLFWLARRYRTPAFADDERVIMSRRPGNPLDLIWYQPATAGKGKPRDLDRRFRGPVEVAVFRSAWGDPNALFLSVKAGYNQVNHGHLDLGQFELDALGVRWARDLGADNYNLPGYWSKGPGGRRWTYYRLNSLSHNVPLINDRSQDPMATSRMVTFRSGEAFSGAVIDFTSAYKPQASKALRGVAMLDRRRALIQDEFTLATPCDLAWGMTTDAAIATDGASAVLTLDGKRLRAEILSPAGAAFTVESAEQKPPQKRNRGVRRLTIRLAKQKAGVRLAVLLTPARPDAVPAAPPALKPLTDW